MRAAVGCFSVKVIDSSHGAEVGDFVAFSGAVSLGGNIVANIINQEYQIESIIDSGTYVILAKSFSAKTITNASYTNVASNSSDSGNGGSSVIGKYQLNVGPSSANPLVGWGASGWGSGPWSEGASDTESLRVWSQENFGEDLIFGPRGGSIYYWDGDTEPLATRAVELSSKSGASNVPTVQNIILISDINRFVFCFGTNTLGTTVQDPML